MTSVRPLSATPRPVLLMLAAALAAQLLWSASRPPPQARLRPLPPPPTLAALQLASLGESIAMSRGMMLYLQSYDDQPGASVPWRQLDYGALAGWLRRALELDPRSQYPLLAASQVYSAVNDPVRTRQMLALVSAEFSKDPNRRWPWLAHAALVARHRLHDLPLARSYARAIREQATGPDVPAWARQLEAIILQDMNELDAARLIIGGLLQSGQITDPQELRFLSRRLQDLGGRSDIRTQADP